MLHSEPVSGQSKLLIICCLAVNAVYGAYLASIGVLLPQLGAAFKLNTAGQGQLMSAGFAGCVVGVLVSGPLSDKAGRRVVVLGCGVIFCAGLTGLGLAHSLTAALLCAPLAGAGSAGMQAASGAFSADLLPRFKAQILNLCQVAFAAGAVIGPLCAAHYINGALAASSWRGVYLTFAAAITVLFVLFAVLRGGASAAHSASTNRSHNASSPATAASPSTLQGLLISPAFLALCTAQLFYAGAEVGYFEWMPTYIRYRAPHAGTLATGCVSLFWFGMTLGRMIMAPLLMRFRPLPLGSLLAICGGAAALATLAADSGRALGTCILLVGLFFGGVYSSILVESGFRFPGALGAAIGGIAAASSCGTSTIPWAVGAVAASPAGWHAGLMLIPISAAISAAVLLALHLHGRNHSLPTRL